MEVNSAQGLPVPASLRVKVGGGQRTAAVQVTHTMKPELLTSPTLVLATIVKCRSMLYTYAAQTLPLN